MDTPVASMDTLIVSMDTPSAIVSMDTYTPDAVDAMDDTTLIAEFSRITGCTGLGCKHCKKTDLSLENFTLGIRAACAKKGLNAETKQPKTCNKQKQASAIRNPVANKFYYRIKKATSAEEVLALKKELKTAVAALTAKA
jgi:hypothetical protein